MADAEKQPLKKGGKQPNEEKNGKGAEGDAVDDDEEDQGCCSKFGDCIATTCSYMYKAIVIVFRAVRDFAAFFWYPCKERCRSCCDRCDKRLNQWKDHSYSNV